MNQLVVLDSERSDATKNYILETTKATSWASQDTRTPSAQINFFSFLNHPESSIIIFYY